MPIVKCWADKNYKIYICFKNHSLRVVDTINNTIEIVDRRNVPYNSIYDEVQKICNYNAVFIGYETFRNAAISFVKTKL